MKCSRIYTTVLRTYRDVAEQGGSDSGPPPRFLWRGFLISKNRHFSGGSLAVTGTNGTRDRPFATPSLSIETQSGAKRPVPVRPCPAQVHWPSGAGAIPQPPALGP